MTIDDTNDTPGKRERTRQAIRDAALASFRERGYEATTIRHLADELGMSVGSAYYHFPSKSHLIQELYIEVQTQHREQALQLMQRQRKLTDRLRTVFLTGLDQLEPFGDHANGFLLAAMSPDDDANPLSAASAEPREILTGLYRTAVEGADDRLPSSIVEFLPDALYRVHLMLSLTWVQDRSPGHERTRRLVERGTRLLSVGLPALKLPPVRRAILPVLTDVAAIGS